MTTETLEESPTGSSLDSMSIDRTALAAAAGEISLDEAGRRFARAFKSSAYFACAIDSVTMDRRAIIWTGFEKTQSESWQSRWGGRDPRLLAGLSRFEPGKVYIGSDLCPDLEFSGSDFFRFWLEPAGFFHELKGVLALEGRTLSVVSLYRPKSGRPYSRSEADRFAEFVPVVCTARKLFMSRVRGERESKALFDCWNALGVGAILVEADGRIVRGNSRALAGLASGSSLLIDGSDDRLRAGRPEVTDEILRRINEVATSGEEPQAGLLRIDRPAPSQPLSLRILPFLSDPDAPYGRPAAIILFCEPEDSVVPGSVEILRGAWKLTPMEARIAAELAIGRTISEIAFRAGITLATARTHLRRVMEKSRTRRQADLVRRTLALVPAARLDIPQPNRLEARDGGRMTAGGSD